MALFIVIWSIWFISEILINRLFRSRSRDMKGADRGSLIIVWVTIVIANSVGVLFSIYNFLPISNMIFIRFAGLFLIVAGLILRFLAIYSLGRFFTVDITIREKHLLKKDGLYSVIRHPSYSGFLLSFLGFGFSLNDWISLVVVVIPVFFALNYRIRLEEETLTRQFGKEYKDYKKKTYQLIPWIY